ncbi:MAG: RsmB/NOP family class I SAM-dependent RNA methyltransferase, partial [Bdellovibrionales bacterium]
RHILRIGTAQIMFMAVPDHAAVDTCVKLCCEAGLERQKGFVNAVLRTITRSGPVWLSKQDEGRLNTPEWLLKSWIEDYGLGTAAEIAKANLSEAPLDITIKNESDRNHYSSIFKATQLLTGTLRKTTGGRVQDLEGFAEGAWWVQDASAAIPAKLFGDLTGRSVVDLCAAPGGKSVQLAAMGADVIAIDRSVNRLKRLEENAERLGFRDRIDILAEDAAVWKPPAPVPYILLDAPCSATGTVRRHPDAPHLKAPGDIARLCDLQARILANAFDMLMVGGVLVYCTCSLQKDEGERQIMAFLTRTPNAARLPVLAEELNGYDESLTPDGDLRILPFHQAALGGMDGFYIARITKV